MTVFESGWTSVAVARWLRLTTIRSTLGIDSKCTLSTRTAPDGATLARPRRGIHPGKSARKTVPLEYDARIVYP